MGHGVLGVHGSRIEASLRTEISLLSPTPIQVAPGMLSGRQAEDVASLHSPLDYEETVT